MKQYLQEVISEVQKHKTDNGNTETLEACKISNQECFMRIDHNWKTSYGGPLGDTARWRF